MLFSKNTEIVDIYTGMTINKEVTMSIKSANHEDFEIAPTKRLKIIRQDRIPIVIPDIFLEVNGVKKPIINYTPFGVDELFF